MASAPAPRIGKYSGRTVPQFHQSPSMMEMREMRDQSPAPKRRAGRKPPKVTKSALRKPVTMPFRPGLINR